MAPQSTITTRPLPASWRAELDRLRARLSARGLLAVLDSCPPPPSFPFQRDASRAPATKLFLGYRKLTDTTTRVESWAYLVPDLETAAVPPILFRDERATPSRRAGADSRPRAATSLLRRAGDLHVPFCFLQYDGSPGVRHVRDMLCAIVLYCFLAAGVRDEALRWKDFTVMLEKALRYIKQSGEYQLWIAADGGSEATMDAEATEDALDVEGLDDSDAEQERDIPKDCETIWSMGSQVLVRDSATLADLLQRLGDKVHLLDLIPCMDVYFTQQTVFPDDFPYRMLIGTWRPRTQSSTLNVFVYLINPERPNYSPTIKLYAHDSPNQQLVEFSLAKLEDFSPLEPFKSLKSTDGASTKHETRKLQALIKYYFLLMENEGRFGDPGIRVHDGFVKALCTACGDLRIAEMEM
ncbi:hypothetical protein BU26DRAFT_66153 [Trematosphaeria pertusa]|uniref:Uncharacterized protein n=1 Tax=Trematosphaeria pertusa TaxID=390896 RepID=A0A6A6I7L5_9PLEO|nr:uncharacterized protein BU26DRAFT_66153 [Trematosphaeria pertusa]KAF2246346.1 hypothetical protein BU26DRAFT_66153 [Trematosphaeria pertusa]